MVIKQESQVESNLSFNELIGLFTTVSKKLEKRAPNRFYEDGLVDARIKEIEYTEDERLSESLNQALDMIMHMLLASAESEEQRAEILSEFEELRSGENNTKIDFIKQMTDNSDIIQKVLEDAKSPTAALASTAPEELKHKQVSDINALLKQLEELKAISEDNSLRSIEKETIMGFAKGVIEGLVRSSASKAGLPNLLRVDLSMDLGNEKLLDSTTGRYERLTIKLALEKTKKQLRRDFAEHGIESTEWQRSAINYLDAASKYYTDPENLEIIEQEKARIESTFIDRQTAVVRAFMEENGFNPQDLKNLLTNVESPK